LAPVTTSRLAEAYQPTSRAGRHVERDAHVTVKPRLTVFWGEVSENVSSARMMGVCVEIDRNQST
jgi:hypothetical protein